MGIQLSKLAISVGTITAATIAWYSWPGRKKFTDSEQNYHILGLENAGSSCFLNAVLQALASLQNLEKWLERNDEINDLDTLYPTIAALYRAVLVVNKVIQKDDYILASTIPIKLANSLRRKGQRIMLTEEQDAVEIMQLILIALYEDIMAVEYSQRFGSLSCLLTEPEAVEIDNATKVLVPDAKGVLVDIRPISSEHNLSIAYGRQGNSLHKPISNMLTKLRPPYRGLIASKLECLSCFGKNVITTESFDILSLPIPMYTNRLLTLKNLIREYLKPVFVHKVDCATCSQSKTEVVKSTFIKSVAFGRLPKTFCFHIMRTAWSEFEQCLSKRIDYVQFPVQLDVSDFKTVTSMKSKQIDPVWKYKYGLDKPKVWKPSKKKPECWYDLRAVICHEGDATSGHYTTYRKRPKENNM